MRFLPFFDGSVLNFGYRQSVKASVLPLSICIFSAAGEGFVSGRVDAASRCSTTLPQPNVAAFMMSTP